MKNLARHPGPALPAVMPPVPLESGKNALDLGSSYRTRSSGLVELDALVDSINNFWLSQPIAPPAKRRKRSRR